MLVVDDDGLVRGLHRFIARVVSRDSRLEREWRLLMLRYPGWDACRLTPGLWAAKQLRDRMKDKLTGWM